MATTVNAGYINEAGLAYPSLSRRCLNFFWFIGGFDAKTLEREECRAVRSKYASMGALVLLTAALGMFSGGYALFTVFHSSRVAAAPALFWGSMILVLDRYLVSSSRKQAVLKDYFEDSRAATPYRSTMSKSVLAVRIAIAVAIGIVVAKPIEVKLMQPLIEEHLQRVDLKAIEQIPQEEDFVKAQNRIDKDTALIERKDVEVQGALKVLNDELDGKGSPKPGRGPVAELKRQTYEDLKAALARMKDERNERERGLRDKKSDREKLLRENAQNRDRKRSFISDLVLIHDLSSGKEESPNPMIGYVSLALTLLFVLIECMPVLAKALSPFDPYDAKLQQVEHNAVINSLVEARRKYAESGMSDETLRA
jgi:Domain of unknown function (DUF4407)